MGAVGPSVTALRPIYRLDGVLDDHDISQHLLNTQTILAKMTPTIRSMLPGGTVAPTAAVDTLATRLASLAFYGRRRRVW